MERGVTAGSGWAQIHMNGAEDLNNFQPRAGLAYNFRKDWVFRAGFAVNTLDLRTSVVDFRNPQQFGKITTAMGGFASLGGAMYWHMIFKLEF